jgi:arylsulfatase A-like enzyme
MHSTANPKVARIAGRRLAAWCIVLWGIQNLTLAAERPNVVVIYADDLGYGDVSCYGSRTIATPQIDRLAREGLRFTDGHSASATCTPSRYALLTGEYPWRKKGTGVLPGDATLIIEPGRTTLASVMHSAGYHCGVVGKWHLGLGRPGMDWNGDIRPGPLEIGFDECFLLPATGDRVPCVYVENHRVAGLDPTDPIQVRFDAPVGSEPTGKDHPELLKVNGISRIGYMSGGHAARWNDEEMADVLTDRAIKFLESRQNQPFFLYFSYHDIHVPRVPHPRFAGKSGMGPRGDVILQMDDCTGRILDALDRLKLTEKTLVIFSSDNGAVIDDGYLDEAVERLGEHRPSGPWRGGKYSAFEGGTRVPFIVRWPGRVTPGTSEALVCQIDLMASLAALLGVEIAAGDALDSQNVLPALLGTSPQGRAWLVEHTRVLGLREGNWKLIEGGKAPPILVNTNTELGVRPEASLYDLSQDPGEQQEVSAQHPERVQAMRQHLQQIRASSAAP